MGNRKTGLPLERHAALGLELARMRDRLTELSTEILRAYPKGSLPHRRASSVTISVDALREQLDARAYAEHGPAAAEAYYPRRELRDAPD